MANATYREIPGLLAAMEEFHGNSMYAEWNDSDNYVVYSYQTPIAVWSRVAGTQLNLAKYSVTTSRHQSLCKTYLPPEDPELKISHKVIYGVQRDPASEYSA